MWSSPACGPWLKLENGSCQMDRRKAENTIGPVRFQWACKWARSTSMETYWSYPMYSMVQRALLSKPSILAFMVLFKGYVSEPWSKMDSTTGVNLKLSLE